MYAFWLQANAAWLARVNTCRFYLVVTYLFYMVPFLFVFVTLSKTANCSYYMNVSGEGSQANLSVLICFELMKHSTGLMLVDRSS